MGRTARFDQIYVANLDAEPVEEETLTGVKSILTKEIEADEVVVNRIGLANTTPTKEFSLGNALFMDKDDTIVFDLKERGRASRFFIENQLAIGTTNPTKAFQVDSGGSNKVNIDLAGKDLMTVSGNTVSTNVIVSDKLMVPGSNIIIDRLASNVISVVGRTKTTNLIATSNLDVGSNVLFFNEGANVAMITGNVTIIPPDGPVGTIAHLRILGNVEVTGNISVSDTATYTKQQNLIVQDPIILMGDGNEGTAETGLLMHQDEGVSNVAMAFISGGAGRENEMAIFRTDDDAETTTSFTVKTSETANLHVYGDIYMDKKLGVSNINPTSNLCIGDKFRVNTPPGVVLPGEDSNVLEVDGFTYTKGIKIGALGLQVGNAVTVNPLGLTDPSASVISIAGNIQAKGLRTTGADGWLSGIANTQPADTLNIGTPAQVTCNLYDGNTWYVYGNTYSSNVLTDFARITGDMRIGGPGVATDDNEYTLKSSGQLVIHANDSSATNDESNALILKSGTLASNVSTIEISAATEIRDHQYLKFITTGKERMRINSYGNVAIQNTSPGETVTIAAPVRINFANTITFGNTWGLANQTSMRMRVRPNQGDAYVESHVGEGLGINFGASKTGVIGTPKLTITEYGGVGIGVTNPHGQLNTSGATVYVNRQVANNAEYDHTTTPLVVTNQDGIAGTGNPKPVMIMAREAASGFGAKAVFDMDRWEAGGSRTRMDVKLAHGNYDDVNVMSIRSDKRVGFGTTDPTATVHISSVGGGNPSNNGLLVYNATGGDNQDAILTAKVAASSGDAFSSYTDANNQGWTVGLDNKSGDRDFRITNNVYAVSNVLHTALFIDGVSSNVGIGTDTTKARLDVKGDIRVSNVLAFSGVTNDEGSLRHHTFMQERQYDTSGRSELFIFKGNDGTSEEFAGPDQIRSVAAQHSFQVYNSAGEAGLTQDNVDDIISDTTISDVFNNTPVMLITGNRRVLIGTANESTGGITDETRFFVNGELAVPTEQRISTTGMTFSSDAAGTINVINSTSDARDFVFRIDDTEKMRMTKWGGLGIGTTPSGSNLHVYTAYTASQDMLKLEGAAAGSGTTKSGIVIHKGDGYGGYIRGYKDATNSRAGLMIGGEYNNSETDAITIMKTSTHSNIGIGTTIPTEAFHLYNKKQKIEVTGTSNAIVEFVTNEGLSNIYASNTGNVHINPRGTHLKIESDVNINGNLKYEGQIEFGNSLGVNLDGESPQTTLHVRGGVITNDDEVACKKYAKTFSVTDSTAKDVQLIFGAGAFYAKITAILRRIDNSTVGDLSTMVIELQGGTGDASTPSLDLAIGTKKMFGGTNSYPWSSTVTTGTRGISIVPYNVDNERRYAYDIYVELTSACGGKLIKITRDISSDETKLDDGIGGDIVVVDDFGY
jgi:hypothetical protein